MRAFLAWLLATSFALTVLNCSGVSSEENANSAPPPPPQNSTSSTYPLLPEKVANAEIEMIDGSIQRIADQKGKILLVNLWGVWCGPCRDEMPHLAALQEKYRDKDFQVIGLNIGDANFEPENVELMKEFAEDMNVNYPLARISNSVTREFNRMTKFDGVPLSVLIDREGRMRGVFLGGGARVINSMNRTVEKVVNE